MEAAIVRPIIPFEDCPNCVYLGPYGEHEGAITHDLWYCPQNGIDTVMAAFGPDVWDYHSGIHSTLPPMVEAKKRAVRRGLLGNGRCGTDA